MKIMETTLERLEEPHRCVMKQVYLALKQQLCQKSTPPRGVSPLDLFQAQFLRVLQGQEPIGPRELRRKLYPRQTRHGPEPINYDNG